MKQMLIALLFIGVLFAQEYEVLTVEGENFKGTLVSIDKKKVKLKGKYGIIEIPSSDIMVLYYPEYVKELDSLNVNIENLFIELKSAAEELFNKDNDTPKTNLDSLNRVIEKEKPRTKFVPYDDPPKPLTPIRPKYPKEANVFRVKIEKAQFFRADHSLDLYKARHAVVFELARILGEFRDYNGGLITKQNELFCSLKNMLGKIGVQHSFLLENFFYSLNPAVMRNILEPFPLKTLFTMLLESLEFGFLENKNYYLKIEKGEQFVYVIITAEGVALINKLKKRLNSLNIPLMDLTTTSVVVYDMQCFGCLYRINEQIKREIFVNVIKEFYETK